MIAAAVVTLQAVGCFGLGAVILRLLGVLGDLAPGERLTWSFALGFGALGWILFFLGIAGRISEPVLAMVLIICPMGVLALGREGLAARLPSLDGTGRFLVGLLVVAMAFDFVEAMAPPADADTLAYHFDLPKRFLAAGRIDFVPRAADGAIPLLVQMTYLPVMGLGGDRALTLWAFISQWVALALVYTLFRRYLSVNWSLAGALALGTVPAILYGGGTGQVETRLILFTVVGAVATAQALVRGHLRFAILAGFAAGFYMASKYLGVIFFGACGLVLLLGQGGLRRGLVFGCAALLAGGQWYAWNWMHTGDPVFPVLFSALAEASPFWDAAHDAAFQGEMFTREIGITQSLLGMLAYPFAATLANLPQLESSRTGLGPLMFLALPFAVVALIRFHARITNSTLAPIAAIAILFYVVWFGIGSPQRVRHLLPIYPLVLVAVLVAAHRWASHARYIRPLVAAVAVTLVFQVAAHGIQSVNTVRHLTGGESRDAFLLRNVRNYAVVPWINDALGPNDRLLLTARQLNYLIEPRIYYAHKIDEALVDIRPQARDPARFLAQLRNLDITHLLVSDLDSDPPGNDTRRGGVGMWRTLVERGCGVVLRSFETIGFSSRTLPSLSATRERLHIVALRQEDCSI